MHFSHTMPQFVDLTMALHPGMRGVAISPKYTLTKDGWNASTYELYSHAGTHMDAPVHFLPGASTIDKTPINQFVGPAWILDATGIAPSGLHDLDSLGTLKERFKPGDSLILHTNWSRYADDARMYRDQLPRISEDLAEWLVQQGARMVLVEAPSVADVNNLSEVTRIHHILLSGGVTIVEGLTNLSSLKSEYVFILALPLKVQDGDGAPARVLAVDGCESEAMAVLNSLAG